MIFLIVVPYFRAMVESVSPRRTLWYTLLDGVPLAALRTAATVTGVRERESSVDEVDSVLRVEGAEFLDIDARVAADMAEKHIAFHHDGVGTQR